MFPHIVPFLFLHGYLLLFLMTAQLQQQHNRLMKINHDLRHKISVMEAQGKALIEQKVELEAGAQTQGQEVCALRQEVIRLRERLRGGGAPGAEGQEPRPVSPAQVNVAGASHSGASSGGSENLHTWLLDCICVFMFNNKVKEDLLLPFVYNWSQRCLRPLEDASNSLIDVLNMNYIN